MQPVTRGDGQATCEPVTKPQIPDRQHLGWRAHAAQIGWALLLATAIVVVFIYGRSHPVPQILMMVCACVAIAQLAPWRTFDGLISALLIRYISGFSTDDWRACMAARISLAKVVLGGIFMIILMPFGLLWIVLPNLPNPTRNIFELWEAAACLWSMLFVGHAVLVDKPKHYIDTYTRPQQMFMMGAISTLGFLVFCPGIVVLTFWVGRDRASVRLGAEGAIILIFCALDWWLWKQYRGAARKAYPDTSKALAYEERAGEFLRFLVLIDAPAALGFAILEMFLVVRPVASGQDMPFAAGAGAFSLVVVNTVYFFLYWHERYLANCRAKTA